MFKRAASARLLRPHLNEKEKHRSSSSSSSSSSNNNCSEAGESQYQQQQQQQQKQQGGHRAADHVIRGWQPRPHGGSDSDDEDGGGGGEERDGEKVVEEEEEEDEEKGVVPMWSEKARKQHHSDDPRRQQEQPHNKQQHHQRAKEEEIMEGQFRDHHHNHDGDDDGRTPPSSPPIQTALLSSSAAASPIGRNSVAPARRGDTAAVSPLFPKDAKNPSASSASASASPSRSPSRSPSCVSSSPPSPPATVVGKRGDEQEGRSSSSSGPVEGHHQHHDVEHSSSGDLWTALKVSIPRPEVEGQTATIVTDGSGSGSSTDRSDGGFTAAAGAATLGTSRVHGRHQEKEEGTMMERRRGGSFSRGGVGDDEEEGVRAAPVTTTTTGNGRGSPFVMAVNRHAGPPDSSSSSSNNNNNNAAGEVFGAPDAEKSDGAVGGVPASASATLPAAAATTPPAAVLVEGGGGRVVPSLSPPKGLDPGRPVIPGIPGAILEQQQQQRQQQQLCKKYFSVEVHITEEGEAVYSFNKSAPARRGKWSRLEEEYAKRIINDFDEGVLDAPVGIGLRQVLASKLRCEVMRVSKKFRGWQCVGKRNFQPVFYHDGRTAKARESLYKMEQTWLRTFPSSLRPSGEVVVGGVNSNGAGNGTTSSSLPGGGGSTPKSLMRLVPLPPPVERDGRDNCSGLSSLRAEMTPAQTWVTRVKQTLASDTPCGSIDSLVSLVKEGRLYCGNVEMSEQGLRDAARRGDEEREAEERRKKDSRRFVSPVGGKEGYPVRPPQSQQHQQIASRGGGHDHQHHYHDRSVAAAASGIGGGGVDGREGMDGHGWAAAMSRARSSSHGSSYHMQGGEAPHETAGRSRSREHTHGNGNSRSPPDVLSPWQRPRAERLSGGGIGGGGGIEVDADPYPVYSKRKKLRGDDASWARRGSRESGNGWSHEPGLVSARAPGAGTTNDPHEHQQQQRRQPPPLYATSRRGERTNAREYGGEGHHQQEGTTSVGGAPPGETSVGKKRYPTGPPPLYEPFERQRASTVINHCGGDSGGDGGGRETTSERDGISAKHAAVGRRPFRLKPAPVPPHMRGDNHGEALYPHYEQVAKTPDSDAGHQYRPAESTFSGAQQQQQQQRRSSEGHGHGYAAKGERRAWGNDLPAAGLPHRASKTPPAVGWFSHNSGASAGGTDSSDYPLYGEHKQHQHQQHHSGRATTTNANGHGSQHRRNGGDSSSTTTTASASAEAEVESYRRMSVQGPAAGPYREVYSSPRGSALPIPPPPPAVSSRDRVYAAPTAPRSMAMSGGGGGGGGAVVVPSNEYGTVVVGPGGRNGSSHTFERYEAPLLLPPPPPSSSSSRWGVRSAAVRRGAEREVVVSSRTRAPLNPHPATAKTVLVGKDYYY